MFNSPRAGQRYAGISPNGLSASYVDENPLANSVYDDGGLDPWSTPGAASPGGLTPTASSGSNSVFSAVIAEANVPSIYHRAFAAVDVGNLGETSVNALSRVLATASLPAGTIDKIVNLVSSKPRVSKLEFFVALALVALAQQGKDISIEQVAALSSQNTLPEPSLDLDRLQTSTSTFVHPQPTPPIRGYSVDPWSSSRPSAIPPPSTYSQGIGSAPSGTASSGVGSTIVAGSGLPNFWWQKQENVKVTLLGHQGFILNRYVVYEIITEREARPVIRRYSEFAFLWDCLVRRYPFRLFPALPPKRLGADELFLEQRRKGLSRALNFVVNHPVIKEDGILAAFLTEPSFETWRKNSPISLEEESASKKVDKIEEMSIPSDFDDKIAAIRGKIAPMIDHWQRICILTERIFKRQEAAAVRSRPALRKHILQTHFTLPNLSPASSTATLPGTPIYPASLSDSLSQSLFGLQPIIEPPAPQGDLARLTNTIRSATEISSPCWRGDDCELSNGVRAGLNTVADHTQRHSEVSEARTRILLDTTLEDLKSQRDLYLATRDLFTRHDRLAVDQVDRLRKRVETNGSKLEGVRVAEKDGWQEEVERLSALIERDQASIAAQLHRRVFIRACLWHELRVVLHNRENTLLTATVHSFARGERSYAENVANIWQSLEEQTEGMPYE